jgi:hypothetical protein
MIGREAMQQRGHLLSLLSLILRARGCLGREGCGRRARPNWLASLARIFVRDCVSLALFDETLYGHTDRPAGRPLAAAAEEAAASLVGRAGEIARRRQRPASNAALVANESATPAAPNFWRNQCSLATAPKWRGAVCDQPAVREQNGAGEARRHTAAL